MDHAIILKKIEVLKDFFELIGLKMMYDFPKDWDLDSYISFEPIQNNYIVNYKGEDRVLLNVNIYIASGLHFVLSGKMGVSIFETIPTDYDLKCKYEEDEILKSEFRDYRLKKVLY
jgi:hypothetical protein